MLYTHCDHSYEMGGRSKIQYDFSGCERELVNEVLYGCTKVNIKESDLNFVFVDDVRHSQLFSQLHKKIPQVSYASFQLSVFLDTPPIIWIADIVFAISQNLINRPLPLKTCKNSCLFTDFIFAITSWYYT